jgi:hypothetical protein
LRLSREGLAGGDGEGQKVLLLRVSSGTIADSFSIDLGCLDCADHSLMVTAIDAELGFVHLIQSCRSTCDYTILVDGDPVCI